MYYNNLPLIEILHVESTDRVTLHVLCHLILKHCKIVICKCCLLPVPYKWKNVGFTKLPKVAQLTVNDRLGPELRSDSKFMLFVQ